MKSTKNTVAQRQRKFLTMLPLIVLPFLTMLFWALGGGTVSKATAQVSIKQGLDMSLPDANLKGKGPQNKMSYYDQAAHDSAKLKELQKNDPYFSQHTSGDDATTDDNPPEGMGGYYADGGEQQGYTYSPNASFTDSNEAKVYQKLDQLNKALADTTSVQEPDSLSAALYNEQPDSASADNEIARLQQMMQAVGQSSGDDPEMDQLNGMLQKILDIQHPDLVQEKLKRVSEADQGAVFAVTAGKKSNTVSMLNARSDAQNIHGGTNYSSGFYSFGNTTKDAISQNAIKAVVHENQTLVNGSTVKLRLTNDVYVDGTLVPKGTFVYGIAALDGERLKIKISSVRYQDNIFPVKLSVYDLDGLNGIYIPGAISRDVAKSSADRTIQNIGLNTYDPSLGAQAASAGIDAVKNLVSKKVKLVKVMLKAGYEVLLKDDNSK